MISMYCSLKFYWDHLDVYPHQIARLGWFYLKTFYQYYEIHIFILLYIVHLINNWSRKFCLDNFWYSVMADLPESRRVSELESHDMPGNVSDCRYSFIRWLAHFVFISKQQDKAIEKSVTNPGSSHSSIYGIMPVSWCVLSLSSLY